MATMDAEPVFIDTNILIYTTLTSSPFHSRALRTLDELERAGTGLWISRQILREYLASMSRPQPAAPVIPAAELVADVVAFQDRFHIAEDGPAVTAGLLALLGAIPMGGKQIHDANIVATMLASGLRRLLTHNVDDFRRFSATVEIIPLEPEA